jgi:hypothetical protein
MGKPVTIVASLSSNHDPLKQIQVFQNAGSAESLEGGIEAAKFHYEHNCLRSGAKVNYRVYKCTEPDGSTHALVEVYDQRGDMSFLGLYKVIANKYELQGVPNTAKE